jgi:hypothetical protein
MSREVRRVALDFDWPLRRVYRVDSMPESLEAPDCHACGGDGSSPAAKRLRDLWWGKVPFDPAETGSKPHTPDTPGVMDYCRRKLRDSRAFYDDMFGTRGEETVRMEAIRLCGMWNAGWRHHLSAQDVEVLLGCDRHIEGITHHWTKDGWVAIERKPMTVEEMNVWTLGLDTPMLQVPQYDIHVAAAARTGETLLCSTCDGEGRIFRDAEHKRLNEAWEPSAPPAGPGYQIWETVSEGSPVSPVFLKPEDLAAWMTERTEHDENPVGHDAWLRFILAEGFAPTGVLIGSLLVDGVAAYAFETARMAE